MMKKILGSGLVGVMLFSGTAYAQQNPTALAQEIQDTNQVAIDEADIVVNSATDSLTISTQGADVAVEVVETEPGADAPVVLSPEALAGQGISGGSVDASIIGRTSKIGENIMILEQNQSFLNQVKTTVDMIGIENTLAMYPEYAPFLETSPMALASQLQRVTTLNELREAVARANGPTDYELEMAEKAAEEQPAEEESVGFGGNTGLMSMEVNDGSQTVMTRDDVAALIEEARLREEQQPAAEQPTTPIYGLSVAEVYGANGQMVAVLSDGASTYKVRMNDEIPQVGIVTMISKDGVTITANGADQIIRFR